MPAAVAVALPAYLAGSVCGESSGIQLNFEKTCTVEEEDE